MGRFSPATWAASTKGLRIPALVSSYSAINTLTGAVGADTFGSWAELVADVGSDRTLLAVAVWDSDGSARTVEVEIGEGAAASEAAITRVGGRVAWQTNAGEWPPIMVYVWRKLTNSARLSARVKDSAGGSKTVVVCPYYY